MEIDVKLNLSFLFTVLIGILSGLILLVLTFLPSKYLIFYFFFVIVGLIFVLAKDKSLILAWCLLFFTAVNRTRGFAYSPYIDIHAGVSFFLTFLVISVVFLVLSKNHIPIRLKPLNKLLFIYSCYLVINVLVSLRYALIISYSFYEILRYISFVLLILFWERISKDASDDKLNKYLLILFFLGAFEGILAIAEVIFRIDMSFWAQLELTQIFTEEVSRAGGSVGGPTGLGNYLAILFPFIFSIFMYKKSSLKLIFLILAAIGLALTFTRIAWLGAGIGTFFIISTLLKRKKFSFSRLLQLGSIALIIFIIILLPFYKNIILATDSLLLKRGDTFSSRIDTYKTGLQIIKDSHFVGIGTNNYSSIMIKNYSFMPGWESITHNSYFVVLAESGVLGLFFFLATYLYSLRLGFKITKYLNKNPLAFYTTLGMIGSVISFLICSFLNATNAFSHSMNLLWSIIAIGLIYGISECRKARTV